MTLWPKLARPAKRRRNQVTSNTNKKHGRSTLATAVSCSNNRSITDDPYWIYREKNLELIDLSSMNEVQFRGDIAARLRRTV